ncbi:hypothetical protein WMY93_028526 [Mugilogobius chulae]|uniref:Uncharacterized protein n=1 Tax=Mugilogobius chulae TaxID=88201 RepID=A0AAW0MNI8_9GOBI
MGCTPSKSVVVYEQDRVFRDQDTCSTLVPSLVSSASTPERPSPRLLETSSGKQTLLSVPGRDMRGRFLNQSPDPSSAGTSSAGSSSPLFSVHRPCSPSPLRRSDTEEHGTG